MAHFSKLVTALLCLCCGVAHAGYAQLAPPSGFSKGAGGWQYQAAANEAWTAAKTVRTTAALNVGGSAVEVPALMRMAANAPRFVARAAFSNPYVLAVTIAAPFLLQWAESKGYFVEAGKWMKRDQTCINTVCYQYRPAYDGYSTNDPWFGDVGSACQAMVGKGQFGRRVVAVVSCTHTASGLAVRGRFDNGGEDALAISVRQVTGSMSKRPATATEFEEDLSPTPMPYQVPGEIKAPVPVELPVVNPSPATNPLPQPLRVPSGAPQAVPNTDPQQYKQPVVVVTPAPTPSSPWQVDVSPSDQVGTDPNGITEPTTPTGTSPETTPSETPDLCALHPDILACQNLDTPTGPELETKDVPVTVTPDNGWGADNAQCPATRYIYPQGRQVAIPFTLFCTYMSGIRPIIIALAWLGAGFILIGARGGD